MRFRIIVLERVHGNTHTQRCPADSAANSLQDSVRADRASRPLAASASRRRSRRRRARLHNARKEGRAAIAVSPTRAATPSLAPVLAALMALSACAPGSGTNGDASVGGDRVADEATRTGAGTAFDRPVVEVPVIERPAAGPREGAAGAPTPAADGTGPRTALGELRARHLPVWTSDFDWAFPPEVCDSAWELDAVAEPASDADVLAMGDFETAAALTVMRYEYQLSRALADPSLLAQLCVSTATVEPTRSEDLQVLVSYVATGARRSEGAVYPAEVVLVGASDTEVVAVACVVPGYSDVVGADGSTIDTARSPARLQAYLLLVSRGLEDQVADVSYRVSQAAHRPADDCGGLDSWLDEWDSHVRRWIAEGRIWASLGRVLTAGGICDSPPPEGPEECPRDWPPRPG